jgi:hypothetical protein
MAYDTKFMIGLIAQNIAKSKTLKEAYDSVKVAACVEGMQLPSYEAMRKNFGASDETEDE